MAFGEASMKDHHLYPKVCIGSSDIAQLMLRGCNKEVGFLPYPEDGSYYAYIVDEEAEIPSHYEPIYYTFDWLWIYSDEERTAKFEGYFIDVYRGGGFGCIIRIFKTSQAYKQGKFKETDNGN
jgi:hypothetical protein